MGYYENYCFCCGLPFYKLDRWVYRTLIETSHVWKEKEMFLKKQFEIKFRKKYNKEFKETNLINWNRHTIHIIDKYVIDEFLKQNNQSVEKIVEKVNLLHHVDWLNEFILVDCHSKQMHRDNFYVDGEMMWEMNKNKTQLKQVDYDQEDHNMKFPIHESCFKLINKHPNHNHIIQNLCNLFESKSYNEPLDIDNTLEYLGN